MIRNNIEPLVQAALQEDLGQQGDITSNSIIPVNTKAKAVLRTRRKGRLAGQEVATTAFRLCDPDTRIEIITPDGSDMEESQEIATIEGLATSILHAERTALNFICHLSGIATATRTLVRAVEGHKAKIYCTRKTTPGLRALEKYAVTIGGGVNHRFGLYDAILIKDNHIAIAGSITEAVTRARKAQGDAAPLEVEIDTWKQLEEVIDLPVDIVLLDNMKPDMLKKAVALIKGRIITEASGGITPEIVREIAATGVDRISSGWITHSAPILDIGLDIDV